jgi:catechol 2,3-dioxygenase-like lactoylglutathione lyase family enzyme
MEMGEMASVYHVQVAMPVGGEDRARWFYGEVLGLTEMVKPDTLRGRGGVWFQSGNLQVHLGVEADFMPARKAHVAYAVEGIDVVRGRFVEAGIGVTDDDALPGFARFYTVDPFGNRVEILEPVTERSPLR